MCITFDLSLVTYKWPGDVSYECCYQNVNVTNPTSALSHSAPQRKSVAELPHLKFNVSCIIYLAYITAYTRILYIQGGKQIHQSSSKIINEIISLHVHFDFWYVWNINFILVFSFNIKIICALFFSFLLLIFKFQFPLFMFPINILLLFFYKINFCYVFIKGMFNACHPIVHWRIGVYIVNLYFLSN